MGNCLVLEEKVIKVMKTDGKILEYHSPIKAQQVLSDFSGHALSDSFSGFHHLQPDAKLLGGRLYYLTPLPSPSRKSKKKKVSFSNPEVKHEHEHEHEHESQGVVRIKLVISKQELQELLQKEGVLSVHDMVSHMQSKESKKGIIDQQPCESDEGDNCRGWKPALESIAELN